MKENPYDNLRFFDKYSRFPRSAQGLTAAGEWHALKKLLPDFHGKGVLDLGCGFRWHCAYAAQGGAARVVGTDISKRMLDEARQRNTDPVIEYQRVAMEDVSFPPDSFDVVLSSLALHYVEDFALICEKVHGFLRAGGAFVFSVEHPVFTAQGPQEWVYAPDGTIAHWPVDYYFEEGTRQALFLGERVTKVHRTLSSYVGQLLRSGFDILDLVEPQPAAHLMDVPDMRDELRRPMMLIISARKRSA